MRHRGRQQVEGILPDICTADGAAGICELRSNVAAHVFCDWLGGPVRDCKGLLEINFDPAVNADRAAGRGVITNILDMRRRSVQTDASKWWTELNQPLRVQQAIAKRLSVPTAEEGEERGACATQAKPC